MSEKYKVDTDAIALRFIIDNLEPDVVLSGASIANHLKQNLKSYNFKLNLDEITKLKAFATSPELYWQERRNLRWN